MDDVDPATTHHFSGNGNIAYGTNTINNTYHTKYSLLAKPKPDPTKPAMHTFFYYILYVK